ncbi:MAG: polysaccharide biosynthesis protein [Lachnospiraceae bacterium]|jgi:stage V sporulation protein B|nr:polysaccharide biosynthesis protein [Lachnospiraceae bacterium]
MDKAKKDGFIAQAGILAVAGILSRIIGLLYNSPMTAIIGDEGNGYYEFAYRAYTIVLLVSSYSIPSAISKVVASHLAVGEYKNAHRIFRGALLYVIGVGGLAGVIVFFFADYLVDISSAATVLRFFAPTILLSGVLGVMRGYFQAHSTMVQTSISQILEQIVNALVSILLAFWLTGLVPLEEATRRSVYGAAGGAIGTGIGVVTGLLFMWGIYTVNRKTVHRRMEGDKTPEELPYRTIFKMLLMVVTPFILSTCIYNFNTYLNQTIFIHIMKLQEFSEVEVAIQNSAIGKATKIANIPIAISSAMSAALLPGIAGDFARKRLDLCRDKVGKAIRATMFIAIPAAVGIGALAKPIMRLLYPQEATLGLSSELLIIMAAGVIFYSLSTLSSAVLQGTGKMNRPVVNAAVALATQTVVLLLSLLYTDIGTHAMALALVTFAFLMCVLNGIAVYRHLEYHQEWDRTFMRPSLIALAMGMVAYGAYHAVYHFVGRNAVSLLVAVAVGAGVYFVLAVRVRVLGAAELKWLPHGERLTAVVNYIALQSSENDI